MKIQVCQWKNCREKQSKYILERIKRDITFFGWKETIDMQECLCLWNCKNAPNVLIDEKREEKMNPVKISEILQKKCTSYRNIN